jgi:magnesium chelatase family protein
MLAPSSGESSRDARRRVEGARRIQRARFRGSRGKLNASMSPASLERHCPIDGAGRKLLEAAVERFALSARGLHRILKVARTIADLSGSARIEPPHLQEAIHFRAEVRRDTIEG